MIASTCLIEDKFVKSLSIPEKTPIKIPLFPTFQLYITHGLEKEY